MKKYILKGKTPVVENDIIKWGKWFGTANRHVKEDIIKGIHISTVFLGINHNFVGGKPILFETRIFGGEHNDYQERYHTLEEAEDGHEKAVELVKKGKNENKK